MDSANPQAWGPSHGLGGQDRWWPRRTPRVEKLLWNPCLHSAPAWSTQHHACLTTSGLPRHTLSQLLALLRIFSWEAFPQYNEIGRKAESRCFSSVLTPRTLSLFLGCDFPGVSLQHQDFTSLFMSAGPKPPAPDSTPLLKSPLGFSTKPPPYTSSAGVGQQPKGNGFADFGEILLCQHSPHWYFGAQIPARLVALNSTSPFFSSQTHFYSAWPPFPCVRIWKMLLGWREGLTFCEFLLPRAQALDFVLYNCSSFYDGWWKEAKCDFSPSIIADSEIALPPLTLT